MSGISGDQRGFAYPLEPVRQKAQWDLEDLQRDLAVAAARTAALRDQVVALDGQLRELSSQWRAASATRIDPLQSQQRVTYLSDVQRRLQALTLDRETAEAVQSELVRRIASQQLALDAIEQDRARCLDEHLAEQRRQVAVLADDDWMARAAWHRLSSGQEAA